MSSIGGRAIVWMLLGGLAAAPPGGAQADDPLAALRWQQRVVLVFAPDRDDERLLRQKAIIDDLGSAREARDLVAVFVVDAQASGARMALDAAALRAQHAVEPADFRVLLVGKDGGVKLHADVPVEACHLLGVIDAMPMRRQEASASVAPRDDCASTVD